MKETDVGFITTILEEQFKKLSSGKFEDKKLYKFIERAKNDLKNNPLSGIKIPKDLWPERYIKEYGVTNLWKYDLPNAWRLVYTIESNEIKIVSIILEWFNHKDYERRFGY